MNSWVEEGMFESKREGRGRGRTRWIVSGGAGIEVAGRRVSKELQRTAKGAVAKQLLLTSVENSVYHLRLDTPTICLELGDYSLVLFASVERSEDELSGGLTIGVSVRESHCGSARRGSLKCD
jgi:hypothetical protein